MTASEDHSPIVAAQTSDASGITAVGTGRRSSDPVFLLSRRIGVRHGFEPRS
jgi:hypothetical protein